LALIQRGQTLPRLTPKELSEWGHCRIASAGGRSGLRTPS